MARKLAQTPATTTRKRRTPADEMTRKGKGMRVQGDGNRNGYKRQATPYILWTKLKSWFIFLPVMTPRRGTAIVHEFRSTPFPTLS